MFKFLATIRTIRDVHTTIAFLTTLTCGLKRRVAIIELRARKDRNVNKMYVWDSENQKYLPKIEGL